MSEGTPQDSKQSGEPEGKIFCDPAHRDSCGCNAFGIVEDQIKVRQLFNLPSPCANVASRN
jgi:hypothetical protein